MEHRVLGRQLETLPSPPGRVNGLQVATPQQPPPANARGPLGPGGAAQAMARFVSDRRGHQERANRSSRRIGVRHRVDCVLPRRLLGAGSRSETPVLRCPVARCCSVRSVPSVSVARAVDARHAGHPSARRGGSAVRKHVQAPRRTRSSGCWRRGSIRARATFSPRGCTRRPGRASAPAPISSRPITDTSWSGWRRGRELPGVRAGREHGGPNRAR